MMKIYSEKLYSYCLSTMLQVIATFKFFPNPIQELFLFHSSHLANYCVLFHIISVLCIWFQVVSTNLMKMLIKSLLAVRQKQCSRDDEWNNVFSCSGIWEDLRSKEIQPEVTSSSRFKLTIYFTKLSEKPVKTFCDSVRVVRVDSCKVFVIGFNWSPWTTTRPFLIYNHFL